SLTVQDVVIGESYSGDENDGCALISGVLADHLRHLETINLRHAHIHQHDGDIVLQKLFKCSARGAGLEQVFAQLCEDCLVAKQLAGLVIHHQDVDFGFWCHDLVFLSLTDAATYATPTAV